MNISSGSDRKDGVFSPDTYNLFKQIDSLKNPSSSETSLLTQDKNCGQQSIEELLFDSCANVKIHTSTISMHLDKERIKKIFY